MKRKKNVVTLSTGEKVELALSGEACTIKQPTRKFELVLCERDAEGKKTAKKRQVYRGDNPRAVEATFLKGLSDKEKEVDVYAPSI
jgi:hypothetical protein